MYTTDFKVRFIAFFAIIILINFVDCTQDSYEAPDNAQGAQIITLSTEELVRRAGYVPLVFNLPTQAGYVINLIRIFNPLINNDKRQSGGPKPIRKRKRSVLFVHGVFGDSNQWILMGVKNGNPQDWSKNDVKKLNDAELEILLSNDLTTRSLPFLLSNFGHDVWLMNRRATKQSRLISKNDAANPNKIAEPAKAPNHDIISDFPSYLLNETRLEENKYFDFSHDEQSAYDLPIIIKHILNVSKSSRLNIVAHGTGCLVAIQTIAKNPEFNRYVNHLAMLGPVVNVHNLHYNNIKNVVINLLANNEFGLSTSLGALDPLTIIPTVLKLSEPICEEHKLRNFPCGSPNDEIFGYGSNQYDQDVANGSAMSWSGYASFHELAQIIQATFGNDIHYFDYRMPLKNKRAYNSTDIAKYNLNDVTLKSISVWRGNTDRFANQYDTYSLVKKLANGIQPLSTPFNVTRLSSKIDGLIPTATLSTSDLVKRAGYEPLVYNLPTQRGYVINLVRIINPLIETNIKKLSKPRRPILFVHGLLDNANTWILMGVWNGKPRDWSSHETRDANLKTLIGSDETSRSLPFLLSNFGFDVWLMNRRNTKQSRMISPKFIPELSKEETSKVASSQARSLPLIGDLFAGGAFNFPSDIGHLMKEFGAYKLYNPDEYFNFSHDEQSAFDLPMVIKHILKVTKTTKLDYVGHATGCLLPLQMLGRNPDLGAKINHLILMAPTVLLSNLLQNNMRNYFVRLLLLQEVQFSTSLGAMDPNTILPELTLLEVPVCANHKSIKFPCDNPVDEIYGYGTNQHDLKISAQSILSYSSVSSFHELAQLAQATSGSEMQYFNFRDAHKNKGAYGHYEIPVYNLANVTVSGSVTIYRGNTDRLANQYDTSTLLRKLRKKNKVDYHLIGNDTEMVLFNHLAYLFHKDIVQLLNIPILKRLSQTP